MTPNEMHRVIYCEECARNDYGHLFDLAHPFKGYSKIPTNDNVCLNGHTNIIPVNLTADEYTVLFCTSKDLNFFLAMLKLKEEDIIEFESRIVQFRQQVDEEHRKWREQLNTPRCPRCASSNITTGARGVGFIRGFFGADKTVNRCGSCGHTWRP